MQRRGAAGRLYGFLVATVLVVALLAGQTAADAQAAGSGRDTQAFGRAGFAYLTGVRTFVAATLWNRLDPIFHDYYGGVPIEDQLQLLPTIQMVIMLDPQFEDAYHFAAWALARRGDVDTGIDIARQGVENNPESGLMRLNYAQILALFTGDLEEAVRQADVAVESATWRDAFEQHDGYAAFGAIYRAAGLNEKDAFIQSEIRRIDEQLGDALPPGSHDHDGDGTPDH
ncbi:MAG: hypothetical protein U1E29_14250 [Coriobacteriia bacterium]|nr:hypothetical protein [Coriobacteriia bacterium]